MTILPGGDFTVATKKNRIGFIITIHVNVDLKGNDHSACVLKVVKD